MADPNFEGSPNLSQEKDSREDANSPTSPSHNDSVDSADLKGSKKREREVSLEPATPKTDDALFSEVSERRTPATKKNRVKLDPTAEEDETPPSSPKPLAELSMSPPYETKVRQISVRVRSMKWEDRPALESSQEAEDASRSSVVVEGQLAPAASISSSGDTSPTAPQDAAAQDEDQQDTGTQNDTSGDADVLAAQGGPPESDSEDQDKNLKRKMGLSSAIDRPSSATGVEPAKRARDDTEEDDNPREKKRPSPPPEEDKAIPEQPQPVAAHAKVGGFLAYASTASPFADAKGPSIFGNKPSTSPFASASNTKPPSTASSTLPPSGSISPTSSAFSIPSTSSSSQTPLKGFSAFASSSTSSGSLANLSSSPTGTKRSGFEAFASSSSPFATAARSKSPTGFNRGSNQVALGASLARSKSPPRRGVAFGSSNAFKSYAGSSSQAFAVPAPPVKKQRQEPGSGSSSETGEGIEGAKFGERASSIPSVFNGGGSPEGSEEESDRQTFGERLRAGKNDNESVPAGSDDEEGKVVVTEQDVQTGEELEDTLFQVRGKLYALSDQNAWKERGTGLLKINVRKSDGGGARLVMRKEAVFTLLLNVTLFKGMRCSFAQDPRYVRFSCIENGKTVHYNIRLANAKVSAELLEEINANIPGEDHAEGV